MVHRLISREKRDTKFQNFARFLQFSKFLYLAEISTLEKFRTRRESHFDRMCINFYHFSNRISLSRRTISHRDKSHRVRVELECESIERSKNGKI